MHAFCALLPLNTWYQINKTGFFHYLRLLKTLSKTEGSRLWNFLVEIFSKFCLAAKGPSSHQFFNCFKIAERFCMSKGPPSNFLGTVNFEYFRKSRYSTYLYCFTILCFRGRRIGPFPARAHMKRFGFSLGPIFTLKLSICFHSKNFSIFLIYKVFIISIYNCVEFFIIKNIYI